MKGSFVDRAETLSLLYGDTLFLIPEDDAGIASKSEDPATLDEANASALETRTAEAPPSTIGTEPKIQFPPGARSGGMKWNTRPGSKLLFILQQTEHEDPLLAEFLNKIVESLGIASEKVGWGIITGTVHPHQFEEMPSRYGILFDGDLWMHPHMAVSFGEKEVYFSSRLAYLQHDAESKRQLWAYLKNLKETLR
jgi:DNA polymerase III psi subunit